jgi:hypothetical protein
LSTGPRSPIRFPRLGREHVQPLVPAVAYELHRSRRVRVPAALADANFARIVLWFTIPVFEADYYCFLQDGRVFSEGIPPYLETDCAPVSGSCPHST